jgi:uncharacterized protein (DUF433 family)
MKATRGESAEAQSRDFLPGHGQQRIADAPITDEDELIARWLEPDPLSGGKAEFRVVGHGVHVWALAGYFRTENVPTDVYVDEAARAYELPREAVLAALAFYRRYQVIVDDRIDANAA